MPQLSCSFLNLLSDYGTVVHLSVSKPIEPLREQAEKCKSTVALRMFLQVQAE